MLELVAAREGVVQLFAGIGEVGAEFGAPRYTAVFAQAEDGGWSGYEPDLPTILVGGETLDEAKENMRTGIELWIEDMKEQGLPIPAPSTQAVSIEVA